MLQFLLTEACSCPQGVCLDLWRTGPPTQCCHLWLWTAVMSVEGLLDRSLLSLSQKCMVCHDCVAYRLRSVSARRKIDCTSAIKSTIECKSSLHISHSSAHSVVKAIVMDCLISPRILLLMIPTQCCIYQQSSASLLSWWTVDLSLINHLACSYKFIKYSDKLKHPRAIAVDGGGVLYVSEWESDGVCLFSSQGKFVELLGNKRGEQVDRVWFSCGHEQLCHCV